MVAGELFILAGGASQRMGVDKARIGFPIRDVPMAVFLGRSLGSAVARVALVRHTPDDLPWCGDDGATIEVITDDAGPRHPLAGVLAALHHTRGEHAVVVPCDLPWLDASVLERLWSARRPDRPVVASGGGGVQPLVGVYPRAFASELAVSVREQRAARFAVRDALVLQVDENVLRNVNCWADTGAVHPEVAFRARVPVSPEGLDRAWAAEQIRLAQRGVLVPPLDAPILDGGKGGPRPSPGGGATR